MLNASVPSEKINLGLPFYGYCHDLSDPNNTTIGAATKGPCVGGSVTGQQGTVLYSQVGQRGPLFFVAVVVVVVTTPKLLSADPVSLSSTVECFSNKYMFYTAGLHLKTYFNYAPLREPVWPSGKALGW